ncbi:hypothetical protein Gotur_013375 [Gossypium turneri]
MYNLHCQMMYLRPVFEMYTRSLTDTRLESYKTRNSPCLVAMSNAHPLQDTLSVDGTCTSVARCLMLEIRTGERHQVLVVGNLHPIGDVMECPEEGMMYSLRRQPVRGPRTLQMIMGSKMTPMWIHLESPGPMVQKLAYFLNRSLFQQNLKMLKGVQMKKKIHDPEHTHLQPTCIMSICLQMMR